MKIKITPKQYFEVVLKEQSEMLSETVSVCEKELFEYLNERETVKIFKSAIDEVLKFKKKDWRDFNNVDQYTKILKIIGKSEEEIKDILDMKFVYDEQGNWDRINKLNTNYTDLANLIIDVLKSANKSLCSYVEPLRDGDNSLLKSLADRIKSNPSVFYEKYLSINKEKYIKNNVKNTELGNKMEAIVINFLKEKNWKLIYQAVEGSPIDTKLGVDIIMETSEGKIAKIQVKKVWGIKQVDETPCEKTKNKFTNKLKPGGFFVSTRGINLNTTNINLVAYATITDDVLLVKKYSPVKVVNKTCIDEPTNNFPSNPRGGFYVDHESVVFSKTK